MAAEISRRHRRTARLAWVLALGLTTLGRPAGAQEQAQPQGTAAQGDWEEGRTASAAADVDVQGVQTDADRDDGRDWLVIPRVILFVPRMVLRYVVLEPLYRGMKLFRRWGDEPGFRLAINSLVRTDFRSRFGLAYSAPSLFGAGDGFSIGFSYGGKEFQRYDLRWKAQLATDTRLTFDALYRREGDEQFHGIGQVEENRTRYLLEELRAQAGVRQDWSEELRTELQLGWSRLSAEDAGDLSSGEVTLTDRFDPTTVPGFGLTRDFGVASLESRIDLRGETASSGLEMLVDSHADVYWDLEGSDFTTLRYGGEIDVGVPLPLRRRMIAARLMLEAATEIGDSTVPFYLLPSIGQGDALRGYPTGRLRDRLLTVAGLEYRWEVNNYADAVLFVDTGRVYRDYADFEFKDWKWGAGGGLRLKSQRRPLGSIQLAYSPEHLEFILLTGTDLF